MDERRRWEKQPVVPKGNMGIANTSDGGLCLLIRDKNGQLWIRQEEKGRLKNWRTVEESNAEKLDKKYGILMADHRRDGRMSVAALGIDGQIWSAWMKPEEKIKKLYWTCLGGKSIGELVLCERCTGGIEMFHLDLADQMWHLWSNPQAEWSQWQTLEGPVKGPFIVINNAEGFPQIFAKNENSSVSTRRHHDNGIWGEWSVIKENGVKKINGIQEPDGRIRLVILGLGGTVQTCRQSEQLDEWPEWEMLPVKECRDVKCVADVYGRTVILGIRYDESIVELYQSEGKWQMKETGIEHVKQITVAKGSDGFEYMIMLDREGDLYIREEL